MQQCGFCSLLSGLIRHTMCVGSRRGSSDSCYKEIGEEETTHKRKRKTVRARSRFTTSWFKRRGEKISIRSTDTEEIFEEIVPMRRTYDSPRRSKELVTRVMQDIKEMDDLEEKNTLVGRYLTLQHKRRRKQVILRSLPEAGLIDNLLFGQTDCLLNQSATWQFNAYALDDVCAGRCLPILCFYLFQTYDLISYFKLDAVKIWKLFTIIEQGYHSTNPYHNSIHAADVTQAMHCFLQQSKILEYLEPVEIMASLLAAMAHDLDHPGVNQTFLVATSNHLAALYENTSVLENHHWRAAMSCLKESGVFDDMPDLYNGLRAQISSLILATDITKQQEYLNKFKTLLDTNTLDLTKNENRLLVLQIALKCADISNPCRPWDISYNWSMKVCEEFFRQGDYERKLNLPITILCDRHNNSIPKIQTGFFKFVVTPLITEWHKFLQNDLSTQMLNNLTANSCKWERLDAEETAEKKIEASDTDMSDDHAASKNELLKSSELLLPLRSSQVTEEQSSFREQLRRFSAPLNLFQDSKFWNKDKRRASSGAESNRDTFSMLGSEQSLQSHLSFRFQGTEGMSEKNLSAEKLLPGTSKSSIAAPTQSTGIIAALKEKGMWKLQRQQTFPPLCTTRAQTLSTQPLYTSDQGTTSHIGSENKWEKCSKTLYKQKDKLIAAFKEKVNVELFKTSDCKKDDLNASAQTMKNQIETAVVNKDEKKHDSQTDPDTLERELRENLAAAQRGEGLTLASFMPRRESLPTDILSFSQNVKNICEKTSAIPQLLCRTVLGKEHPTRRRGSAPAPVAQSDLRLLSSLGPMKHNLTGGSRKPSSIASCQQSFARTPYGIQEGSIPVLTRRCSLPVEVITGISSR